MSEHWEQWVPAEGLAPIYDLHRMSVDRNFIITLCQYPNHTADMVTLDFSNSVQSHRRVYETFRHKLIVELSEKYGIQFYRDWSFFRVYNSNYLKWIEQESCAMSAGFGLTHYCLLLYESVIDIAAVGEPKISFIKSNFIGNPNYR